MTKNGSDPSDPKTSDGRKILGDKTTNHKMSLFRKFEGRAATGQAGTAYRYSYFVGIMRYALPIIAIFLICLVVVWPLMTGREDGFRITYSKMENIDGSLKMINARYIGIDENNRPFTVTATEAVQSEDDSNIITLQNITADIFEDKDTGGWYALTASEGVYKKEVKLLDLIGKVTIFSDAGHELVTESAHINLARGIAEGNNPVQGQSPMGLLNAGNFRFIDRGQTTFFGDRVKLVIFPQRHKG